MSTTKDIYIAVISSCRFNKREFIRLCTGGGTGLVARFNARQIRGWPFTHQGQRIHLIETPVIKNRENHLIEDCKKLGKWLETERQVAKNEAQLDGIILLHDFHYVFPRISMYDYLELLVPCDIEKSLSRIILAMKSWDWYSLENVTGFESSPKGDDSDRIRTVRTKQSCLATLDMLLQQINSDGQDRSVEQTAKHQGEINAAKQKKLSSKKAQATLEAEEKRNRSADIAATKYEEEITALEKQIINLEKANEALNAENERYHAALAASTNEAAVTQEYESQIEALKTELDEKTKEVAAMKAYIAEAERTATGFWRDVEIPPIPYSLEPPRQASD